MSPITRSRSHIDHGLPEPVQRLVGDACGGASAAGWGTRLLAPCLFNGAERQHVVGQWLPVAMSEFGDGGYLSPCHSGGGARRVRALESMRPWVTATLIVQNPFRLGQRGRPAVWRSIASERWLGRHRRGQSTSW